MTTNLDVVKYHTFLLTMITILDVVKDSIVKVQLFTLSKEKFEC